MGMQPITVSLCIFALLNKESNGQPVRNETRRETSCSVRNRLLQQTAATKESFLFLHGRSHHHKHLQIRMNQIKKENIRQDRTTHYDISPTPASRCTWRKQSAIGLFNGKVSRRSFPHATGTLSDMTFTMPSSALTVRS